MSTGCTAISLVRYSRPEINGVNEYYSINEDNEGDQHGRCIKEKFVSTMCSERYRDVFQYDLGTVVFSLKPHNCMYGGGAVGILGIPLWPIWKKSGYGHSMRWIHGKDVVYISITVKRKNPYTYVRFYPETTVLELTDGKKILPESYAVMHGNSYRRYERFEDFPEVVKCHYPAWYVSRANDQKVAILPSSDRIRIMLRYPVHCPPDRTMRMFPPSIECDGIFITIPSVQFKPGKYINFLFAGIVPSG